MHALARVLGVRGGTLPAAAPRSLRALGGLCQEDGAALEGSPRCPESCPAPCPGGALGFGSCSGWGGQQVRAGRGGTWDLALRGCPGLLVDLVWTQEEDQAGRGVPSRPKPRGQTSGSRELRVCPGTRLLVLFLLRGCCPTLLP